MLPSVAVGSVVGAVGAALLAVLALRSPTTAIHVGAPAVLVGIAGWMFFSARYERTLAVLLLYLGLFDGFLKLKTGATLATLGRDVLLYAIAAGATVRLVLIRRPVRIPPLTLGVIFWVVLCLAQVLNPVVPSIAHGLASVRQHIEFVPLFFLGYAVMRSERRVMGLLALLLFAAAANGVVSLVQSHLTPAQLAAWGPGYAKEVFGTGSLTGGGRTFVDAAGVSIVRPPALGSDFGFGGIVAAMALPGALALAAAPSRFRRYMPLLGIGLLLAVVGLATSQARTAVVAAVIAVIAFLLLTVTSRRGLVTIVVAAILTVATYAGVTTLFGTVASGPNRYGSIAPTTVISTTISDRQATLSLIPTYLIDYPLGAGIGSAGPAGGSAVGGQADGAGLNAESEPNFLLIELGIPGLVAMLALTFCALKMGIALRRVAERRLQYALAALTAVLLALCCIWVVGATTANSPTSPFIWLSFGIIAYWYSEMRAGRVAVRPRRIRATLTTR